MPFPSFNFSVPYRARIYRGDLLHDPEEASFHVGIRAPLIRSLLLTNHLPFDVAIWNVSLNAAASEYFQAQLVSRVVTIRQGQVRPSVLIRYVKQATTTNISSAFCTLHTNVTEFNLPIHVFDGKLEVCIYVFSKFEELGIGDWAWEIIVFSTPSFHSGSVLKI